MKLYYCYRTLQKHKPEGYQVSFQNSDKFWEHKTIRPDIITNKTEIFIIDTKWKIVDANNPSDGDLKQMFTYNLHWKAEKSLLLYPSIGQIEKPDFGNFYYKSKVEINQESKELNNKYKLAFNKTIEKNYYR